MSTSRDLNQINEHENQDFDNLDEEQIIRSEYGIDEKVTNTLLTESSVEKQFREFENNLTDPYATVKGFAQSQREKFNNDYSPDSIHPNRLNTNPALNLSDRATSLFNYAAKSVVESANDVNRRQELQSLNQGHHLVGYRSENAGSIYNSIRSNTESIVTGLINRPGVAEYNNLFSDSYGTLNATFFQFQNKQVVSKLLERQNETKIITQGLIPNSTGKANEILANNEITAQLSNLPNKGNLNIIRAYSDTQSSIHPKMGYNDKYAFIGTQNITNALPKYNTQENLLVIKRSNNAEMHNAASGFRSIMSILQNNIALNRNEVYALNSAAFINANQFAQGILAEQIVTAQNSLLSVINEDEHSIVSPIKFASRLSENLKTLSNGAANNLGTYVFTSADIFNRLSKTIASANKLSTTDRVVISGKELNVIFNNGNYNPDVLNFKENVLALAKTGRLTIVTDHAYINNLTEQNLNPNSNNIDQLGRSILNELTQRNQIRGVSLSVNHEKSTMVFGGGVDDAGQLKFLATGSANYSVGAMLNNNKNTELMLAIGIGNYQQDSNSLIERTMGVSILSQLNREVDNKTVIYDRYETLSGLDFLTGKTIFSDTRVVEQNASTLGVNNLRTEIAALNKRLGGNLIELSDRFNSSGKLIGLRTIIRPLDNIGNHVIINLSVNREQNVILSDLNKIISGSVFVNSGVNTKTINGESIKPGQSVQMSSLKTAVGFLATITRELSNQSRYELVDKTFFDLVKTGNIDIFNMSTKYLSLLTPNLVQDLGQGVMNLETLQHAIRNKYGNNQQQLAADIANLSSKIASGNISRFSNVTGGFTTELKANAADISKRYTVIHSLLTSLTSGNAFEVNTGLHSFANELYNDPNRVLADFRLEGVLSTTEGKRRYKTAFDSLSSSLVNLVSSPFLAIHEQTYGSYQASARTPVYGEGDVIDNDSIFNRLKNEGFLNPLSVAHSTKIGEAAEFYRGISHTAAANYLKLPAFGGLNQVKLTDSSLHEGAVAIYNYKKLFSSLNNHGFIDRSEYKSQIELILNKAIKDDDLNNIFGTSNIIFNYALPESKLEQLQQRLKNITGARVDLDINADLVRTIQQGQQVNVQSYINNDKLLTGNIKASLARGQAEQVKEFINTFKGEYNRAPSKSEITAHFRSLEFDRTLGQRGVIGEEEYKRVAINAGFSNMGDYIYGNASALPQTGYLRLLKIKLDTKNVNNLEDTQNKLITAFKQGNVIYNEPVEIHNQPLLNELKSLKKQINSLSNIITFEQNNLNEGYSTYKIDQKSNEVVYEPKEITENKINALKKDLASLKRDFNKKISENSLIITEENNQEKYKLDKGLYGFDEQGKPIQLGRFEREGIITLNNINITDSEGRHTALSFKVGSAKDKGYSVFTQDVSIVAARDKGVITVEASELVIKNPSSGIRLVGVKGPVLYMDRSLFTNVEEHLDKRDEITSRSGRVSLNVTSSQQIYSINTFSQFKEFSYESGIKLLSVDSIRETLTGDSNIRNITGYQLAENLALLFIEKDKKGAVRSALKEHLSNTGRRQVAQTLNNINGGDFSEMIGSKSKYNLGVIANGLTMLANPNEASYNKNVIEGNLTGVKDLVLKALQKGPQGDEARSLLMQQTKSLINLAYEKGAIYGYNNEFTAFEDSSPIVKGAGVLTHVNFIGSQLLNNPFVNNKSTLKSGLHELRVDDVHKYLTDNIHKQKVDFIASTAGLSLTEFNKQNTPADINKLKTKLTFLQKQFDSGVIIEDIKSITTSSSLVASGVNNETAFEYQNLAGASIGYLNRYRRENKIRDEGTLIRSKESQTIRTAYSIILSATLNEDHMDDNIRSLPSDNAADLISYRSILHKPAHITSEQGWHNERINNINSLINNYTPIANKLGLLNESVATNNIDKYSSVGKINTMVVGVNNDPAVVNRAVSIAEVTGKFSYYSELNLNNDSLDAAIIQRDSLHNSLLNNTFNKKISSLDLVSKVISTQYTKYLEKIDTISKNNSSTPDIMLDSFSEFVTKQGSLFSNDIYNKQVINTIKELENSKGMLKNVKGDENTREELIKLAISIQNTRSEKLVEESLYIDRVGRSKQYIDAMLSIHDKVQTKLNENIPSTERAILTETLNEVSKTKNLILPAFKTIAQADGTHILQFSNITEVSAHQGTLLGTDVIGKVPLVFPGHVEDVLINQIRLRKQIEAVQPLLAHIQESVEQKRVISINGEQVEQLYQLTNLMGQSIEGIKSLANTSFAQKSYGEGETFYGNNTIPVNSLAISANEAVVGGKINHLVEGNPVQQVIDSYFNSLKETATSNLDENTKAQLHYEEINRLKTLYGSLGAKGDNLHEAAAYEHALQQTYPSQPKALSLNEINNLQQRYTEAVTGIPFNEIDSLSTDVLQQHYNAREVAVRRGGAPAGIAAQIADHFYNKTLNVNTYNRNIATQNSELAVDTARAYTAVILPTLSHLIAQQGDFDGDSFQLLMSNAGDTSQQLLNIKNTQRNLLNKINERQSIITRRSQSDTNNTYNTSTEDILSSITSLQDLLKEEQAKEDLYLNSLSKSLSASKVVESSELFHMKKWTAFNQAIPIGAIEEMSAGTLTSFSNFARTTIGNIEANAEYSSKIFDKYERQLQAFTTLQKIYGPNFNINEDHTDKLKLETHRLNLLKENINISTDDIDEAFTAIKSLNSNALDPKNVSQSLLTYHAAQSSMSQAFDAYIKHNTKAAGTLLNPEQIDLMQGLIGQAGTDLLGKSYNTLIPLLDQAMSDKGLQDVLSISLNKTGFNNNFHSALYSNADKLGMSREEADNMVSRISSEDNINKVNTRSEATFAFLGSMQQVIRDALKDKSGRGLKSQLTDILQTEYEEGKTVGSILDVTSSDLSYEQINKARNLLFKHFVGTKLGSNLNIEVPNNTPDNIKQLFNNARRHYVDSGVTGFGGLLMLRELSLTENHEDFQKRFIDNDLALLEEFNKGLKNGTIKNAQEFATKHVLGLLQRTQASFADAMLEAPQREEKINALIKYGKKYTQQQIDNIENEHAKAGLQLIKDYGEFRETTAYTSLSSDDKVKLNSQFSQDVSLHTIRERGGLTVEDLYHLQATARETKRLQSYQESNNVDANSIHDASIHFGSNISQEASGVTLSTIQRMLRRGQLSADQAQSLFLNKLTNIEAAIGDQQHLSPEQQHQTALMLGFNTRADLNDRERMLLAQTISTMNPELQHNSQSIQALYSTAEQFDDVSKAIKLATSESQLADLNQRQTHLRHLMNQYTTNIHTDRLQTTNNDIGNTPHILENILNSVSLETQLISELHKTETNTTGAGNNKPRSQGITLRHDPHLTTLGALAVPLFLGVFKDGVNLDERALAFGYDVLQSTAHLATKQERLITKVGELNSENIQQRTQNTANNFQRGRISQSLLTEGALIGGLQSIAQETMFMGLSEIAYKGVDKLLARSGYENMKVGRGLGVIAAEVLTTVAAMSISKAFTKQRTQDNDYVPDFVTRMLQDFAQQIWMATQQAQLDQNKLEYEVIDTDENMNLESTVSGLMSEIELDIATGYIDFDDESASIDNLSSSIPTFKSSYYG